MSRSGNHLGRDRRPAEGAIRGRPATAAGLRVLIPGYPQWRWRQRERALVLLGSYLVALGVGCFAWGTPIGFLMLAFAYATHIASATDVILQDAFPGFGRWVPLLSTSGGLGVGLYGPLLVLATLVAWPAREGATPSRYVVNCWAYAKDPPQPGDWVWLQSSTRGPRQLGRVIAGPGQDVEWIDGQLRLDGQRLEPFPWARPQPLWSATDLAFTVPSDHALIAPASNVAVGGPAASPVLVPGPQILGRPWAQLYPIRRRRLLR